MQRNDSKFIARQVRIAKQHSFTKICPGKFRKRKAMDCGNPRCKLCGNPRKAWGYKSLKEVVADQVFKYEVYHAQHSEVSLR